MNILTAIQFRHDVNYPNLQIQSKLQALLFFLNFIKINGGGEIGMKLIHAHSRESIKPAQKQAINLSTSNFLSFSTGNSTPITSAVLWLALDSGCCLAYLAEREPMCPQPQMLCLSFCFPSQDAGVPAGAPHGSCNHSNSTDT